MTALAVDGDIVAYRTAAVCESHFEKSCETVIDDTMTAIASDTGISTMRVYLTSPCTFRKFICQTWTYKGNRHGMARPQYLNHCKDYLRQRYGAQTYEGYEADDCIASDMVQTGAFHCGIDKDMLQIAGRHYNYVNKEWRDVSTDEARLILCRQVLMGDASDNVPGLPKIGPKKAEQFVSYPPTAYKDALDAYIFVCGQSMPDVDPYRYFMEQYGLIAMQTGVKLSGQSVQVKSWGLE